MLQSALARASSNRGLWVVMVSFDVLGGVLACVTSYRHVHHICTCITFVSERTKTERQEGVC